ncbi:NAD(P)-dependent oxidoreductase [Caenimonas soli]|uniref:NAD(P)-dependent oxidoreductase n=1 Tax=Caenimonas soli TaxID=2735555 RepID=UPI002E2CC5A4|nr:NAD(P)-dependent oxidoreductase [Caenimonas soli]
MRIAFIGLGRMGAPMARNLLAAGHQVHVHDAHAASSIRLIEGGARWAETPGAAAVGAEVAITCLPGPTQVDVVARGENGILEALAPGSVWIDCTTSTPSLIRELSHEFVKRGVDVLDAPVSGGPAGAEQRALLFWVGGSASAYARCLPVLGDMSDEVMHVGPLGSGLLTKLAHNSANFTVQAVIAEAFIWAVKAGMDPLILFNALRRGLGTKRVVDRLAEQFLPGTYDPPAFALDLANKDLGIAIQLAQENDLQMPFTELMKANMEEAIGRGWGARDARIALSLQAERAGVDVHVDRSRIRDEWRDSS